jgi:hypothetical protein
MKTLALKPLTGETINWKGLVILPEERIHELACQLRNKLLLKSEASNLAKRLTLFDILTGSQPEKVIEILNSGEDYEVIELAICWLDCKGYQEKRVSELIKYSL